MKVFISIVSFFLITCLSSLAQPKNEVAFKGNCDTTDTEQNIGMVAYIYLHYDSLFKYSIVFPCGAEYNEFENRQLVEQFHKIVFNRQEYLLSQLFLFVVNHTYDSTSQMNEYVFELRNSSDSVVAVDYASKVYNSTNPDDSTLKYYNSYMFPVDATNSYGGTYTSSDTTENIIYYKSSTNYLKSIIDTDRSKIVGLHYYSPANNEEYKYFFEANN